jgi:nucleoside-diphosphate-sugar epimerase
VIGRCTPLPSDAPPRSLVEERFLETYSKRVAVLNLVGLHGHPPVPKDMPHSAPRLVPNFLKRVAPTKDALKQKGSVHFIHGSDAAHAILLVYQKAQEMLGRWIVSDCLVRDWWAIALELGGEREKGWVVEIMRDEKIRVLPRQKGLGRIMDGSEFWIEVGSTPGYVGLSV